MNSAERPRIVVGVDGFESSKAALRWAIHQAKLTGAVVEAVTAWQIPAGTGLVPMADMPDYQDDARTVLAEVITEMCTTDTEVEIRPQVVHGRAAQVLVDEAEGAELLVVGCRGHGGSGRTGRRRGARGSGRGAAGLGRPVLRAPRAVPGGHHARQARSLRSADRGRRTAKPRFHRVSTRWNRGRSEMRFKSPQAAAALRGSLRLRAGRRARPGRAGCLARRRPRRAQRRSRR